MRQKRAAAVHDISCLGKCSLTVALPILSAAGIEACPVPTSLLSTHTGGFKNVSITDLTDRIEPITDHWASLGLRFDAIYTGYLGSFRQLDIVGRVIEKLRTEETLVIVDPVMADNGRLYGGFSEDFPRGMAELCRRADIITPNMTEAAFLLGEVYREGPYDREYILRLLKALKKLCGCDVVLTGVYTDREQLGSACLTADGCLSIAASEWIEGAYHGTGDIFTAVLTASLLGELELTAAMRTAGEFVSACVRRTKAECVPEAYGVNFEDGLCELRGMIESAR